MPNNRLNPFVSVGANTQLWTSEDYVFKQEIGVGYEWQYKTSEAGFSLIGAMLGAGCRYRLGDRILGAIELNYLSGFMARLKLYQNSLSIVGRMAVERRSLQPFSQENIG